MSEHYIAHKGVPGMKWGVQNGPPYPLYRQERFKEAGAYTKYMSSGGSYVDKKKKRTYKKPVLVKNTKYDKRHIDKTIAKGTKLQTLTRNPDRLKNTDMFYATYDKFDNAQFRYAFNRPVKEPIYNDEGEVIGSNDVYKMNAATVAKRDIKVASEDSCDEAFRELFTKDRDFYNFCTDKKRLLSYVESTPWVWITDPTSRGIYGKIAIKSNSNGTHRFTQKEVDSICRIFTTGLPNDGTVWKGRKSTGTINQAVAKDYARQRAKFFKTLSKAGYDALLDSTDAIDMKQFKSNAPVIVFNMKSVIPKEVMQLTYEDVRNAKKDFSKVKRLADKFAI